MKAIKLNSNGDIDQGGASFHLIEDADAVAQLCQQRLRTFRGDWFLGRKSVGVPYYEEVLNGNADLNSFLRVLRSELQSTPGVESILSLDVTPPETAESRTLLINYQVKAKGQTQPVTISQGLDL